MKGLVLVRTIEASQGPEQPQLGPQHGPRPGAVAQLTLPCLPVEHSSRPQLVDWFWGLIAVPPCTTQLRDPRCCPQGAGSLQPPWQAGQDGSFWAGTTGSHVVQAMLMAGELLL